MRYLRGGMETIVDNHAVYPRPRLPSEGKTWSCDGQENALHRPWVNAKNFEVHHV
jgi:hypothetical protein